MRRLQFFDFRSSSYERPDQEWVCGRAALGAPCRIGPSLNGVCQATFECSPRRDGDRWECSRPPSAGGVCEAGPMPDGTCCLAIPTCTPVRSMRGVRGQIVRWAVVTTLGFIAVLLGTNGGAIFMPGPMIDGHSSFTNCNACHSTVESGAFGWVHSVFAEAQPVKDSGKCLACHVVGDTPLKAHGLPAERLDGIADKIRAKVGNHVQPVSTRIRDAVFPATMIAKQDLPCATCHGEHKGRSFDLTAMTDAQCQACHAVQFSSFSSGHPPFGGYPYLRRTRIIFDHNSHFARHFPETAAKPGGAQSTPQACGACHELGPRARLMGTRPFEQTCSACHGAQITGADRAVGPRGVPFLSVPGLDLRTLSEKGAGIGAWPEFSEAGITPFMALLLAADPAARRTLTAVQKIDLLNLKPGEVAAAERFAWDVKALFFELSTSDPAALKQRFAKATGRAPDDALIGRLVATMPRDVLLGARREWFPGLFEDLAAHKAGRKVPIPGMAPQASSAPPSRGAAPKGKSTSQAAILPAGKDDILSGGGAPKDSIDILSGGGGAPKDSIDILSGGGASAAPKDSIDILSGGGAPTGGVDILSGGGGSAGGATPSAADAGVPATEPAVNPEKFASLGGWYRQDFRILFHPTGHADPFLRAWLTYSGGLMGSNARRWVEPVFAYLTGKDAQGQCAKCHSVDAAGGGALVVNWGARPTNQLQNRLTGFSHAQHFGVVGDRGCMTCHRIDEKAKYRDSYAGRQPDRFQANFRPLSRDVCATCHTASMAGDNCLQCHNYHVDRIVTPFLMTKLPSAKK